MRSRNVTVRYGQLQNIGSAAAYSVLLIVLIALTFLLSQRILKTGGAGRMF